MTTAYDRARIALAQPLPAPEVDEQLFGAQEQIGYARSFMEGAKMGNLTATAVRGITASAESFQPLEGYQPGTYISSQPDLKWLLDLSKEDAHVSDAIRAHRSPEETQAMAKHLRASMERQRVTMANPVAGVVGLLAGGVVDLPSLIPGVGWVRGVGQVVRGAAAARTAGAARLALLGTAEGGAFASFESLEDPRVSGQDAAIYTALGATIGGGIGALLPRAAGVRSATMLAEDLRRQGKVVPKAVLQGAVEEAQAERALQRALDKEAKAAGAAAASEVEGLAQQLPVGTGSLLRKFLPFEVLRSPMQRWQNVINDTRFKNNPAVLKAATLIGRFNRWSTPTAGEIAGTHARKNLSVQEVLDMHDLRRAHTEVAHKTIYEDLRREMADELFALRMRQNVFQSQDGYKGAYPRPIITPDELRLASWNFSQHQNAGIDALTFTRRLGLDLDTKSEERLAKAIEAAAEEDNKFFREWFERLVENGWFTADEVPAGHYRPQLYDVDAILLDPDGFVDILMENMRWNPPDEWLRAHDFLPPDGGTWRDLAAEVQQEAIEELQVARAARMEASAEKKLDEANTALGSAKGDAFDVVRARFEERITKSEKRVRHWQDRFAKSKVGSTRSPARSPKFLDFTLVDDLPKEPGFVYHATNKDNAFDIQDSGEVSLFRPEHGTDQDAWPDGTIELRSYWTDNPNIAKSFPPEGSQPVLLRTKRTKQFKTESTSDIYTTKKVTTSLVEYLSEDGTWKPLGGARGSAPAATGTDEATALRFLAKAEDDLTDLRTRFQAAQEAADDAGALQRALGEVRGRGRKAEKSAAIKAANKLKRAEAAQANAEGRASVSLAEEADLQKLAEDIKDSITGALEGGHNPFGFGATDLGETGRKKPRYIDWSPIRQRGDERLERFLLQDPQRSVDAYLMQVGGRFAVEQTFGDINDFSKMLRREAKELPVQVQDHFIKDMEFMFAQATGAHLTQHPVARQIAQGLKNFNIMGMLGSSGFSLWPDLGLGAKAFRSPNAMRFLRSFFFGNAGRVVKTLRSQGDSPALAALIMGADFAVDPTLRLRRLMNTDGMNYARSVGAPGTPQWKLMKLANKYGTLGAGVMMRVNLMNAWDTALVSRFRMPFMLETLEDFAKPWDQIATLRREGFLSMGVDELRAKAIHEQFKLHNVTVKGVKMPDLDKWAPEPKAWVERLIDQTAREARVTPSIGTSPRLSATPMGSLFFQFTSFPYEAQQKFVRGVMANPLHPVMMQSVLFASLMAAVADAGRHAATGRMDEWEESWTTPKGLAQRSWELHTRGPMSAAYTSSLMDQMVILGGRPLNELLTDIGVGPMVPQASRLRERNIAEAILGPTAASINRVGLLATTAAGAAAGIDSDIKALPKAALRTIPFGSHFLVRGLDASLGD